MLELCFFILFFQVIIFYYRYVLGVLLDDRKVINNYVINSTKELFIVLFLRILILIFSVEEEVMVFVSYIIMLWFLFVFSFVVGGMFVLFFGGWFGDRFGRQVNFINIYKYRNFRFVRICLERNCFFFSGIELFFLIYDFMRQFCVGLNNGEGCCNKLFICGRIYRKSEFGVYFQI